MAKTILLTAAEEDSGQILAQLPDRNVHVMHFPLERYVPVSELEEIEAAFHQLADFENIVYGSKRNAKFFIKQVEQFDKKENVRSCVNLTLDEETAGFLEKSGVPAVCTHAAGKAINLVEFMLRLRRTGATLYPCGSHKKEELPGFFEELDIPVKELELFHLTGPKDEDLVFYRKEVKKNTLDVILFHSRRAITRTLAAFPDLDYESIRMLSADKGVTNKLKENGLAADAEGEGNWESMAELL